MKWIARSSRPQFGATLITLRACRQAHHLAREILNPQIPKKADRAESVERKGPVPLEYQPRRGCSNHITAFVAGASPETEFSRDVAAERRRRAYDRLAAIAKPPERRSIHRLSFPITLTSLAFVSVVLWLIARHFNL